MQFQFVLRLQVRARVNVMIATLTGMCQANSVSDRRPEIPSSSAMTTLPYTEYILKHFKSLSVTRPSATLSERLWPLTLVR